MATRKPLVTGSEDSFVEEISAGDFISTADISDSVDKRFLSDEQVLKLTGIADGAEVNVQSDWDATTGDALILNKPSIPTDLADLNEDSTHQVVTAQERSNYKFPLSTGIINRGGNITVNGVDNTKIDIPAGTSLYVDFSNPLSPVIDIISWSTQTLTPPDITSKRKWVGIERTAPGVGSIVFASYYTQTEKRTIAILGRVRGDDTGVIVNINEFATPSWGVEKTLEDLIDTMGSLNRSGNVFYINTGLLLAKTAGASFRFSAGSGTTMNSPNIHDDPAQTSISNYYYHIPDEASASVVIESAVDPNYYDLAGVKTAVPAGKFTVQRIYFFPKSGSVDLTYGQVIYDTLTEAISGIATEAVSISEQNVYSLTGTILRSFLCVQQGTTDLTDTAKAKIVTSTGVNSSGGGVSGDLIVVAGNDGEIQVNYQGDLSASPLFKWSIDDEALTIGGATFLPDNPVAILGNSPDYVQTNIHNENALGSCDYVVTSDTGDDTQGYADFGISNSTYTSTEWDVFVPYDTYLIGDGGNIVIGSMTPSKNIQFFVANTIHEAHPADVVATIDADGINIPTGSTFKINGVAIGEAGAFSHDVIGFTTDGAGSAITTGSKGYRTISEDCTISEWSVLGKESGSCVIDVKRCSYSTFPTFVSIAGTEKPTLSSSQKNQDTSLSTWTTSLLAGDILEFVIDSVSTLTRVTLNLKIQK